MALQKINKRPERFFHRIGTTVLTAGAFAVAFTSVLLTGCGGGGGGRGDSEFVGAANVLLSVTPNQIDTGDNTRVNVRISNIHEDGIALKIRYPKGLEYVPDSAVLQVEESERDVDPTHHVTEDDEVYLVFYISENAIGSENEGTLMVELKAIEDEGQGSIEVDPDVDDPRIANGSEFDANEPQFDPEDAVNIRIKG